MFLAKGINNYWDNRFLEYYSEINIEEQVEENLQYLTERDWEIICRHCKLDLPFLYKYYDYIEWQYVSENPYLTEDILSEFGHRVNWDRVWRTYPNIDEHFVKKFKSTISSVAFCENKNVPFKLIKKFAKILDWYEISWVKWITTEDFIREFQDYVDWEIIVKNECNLSEEFIREFIDYFDIYYLVKYRLGYSHLKNLLREFKDKIDWDIYKGKNYTLTTSFDEVYDYWWGKNKTKRKRLKYGIL